MRQWRCSQGESFTVMKPVTILGLPTICNQHEWVRLGNPADSSRLLHDAPFLATALAAKAPNTINISGLERRDGLWHSGTPT